MLQTRERLTEPGLQAGLHFFMWVAFAREIDFKIDPMRLVLDTNILVSIFLYEDPRHRPLLAGHAFVIDALCYEEAANVLRSDRFEAVRAKKSESAERLLKIIFEQAQWIKSAVEFELPPLPICRDPDDQKFLSLAARGQADAVITYDKALLKCRHKVPFKILRPEQFLN